MRDDIVLVLFGSSDTTRERKILFGIEKKPVFPEARGCWKDGLWLQRAQLAKACQFHRGFAPPELT
jgi:hypothetical protein